MFIRKYWIPLLVFSIAIVGVGLYLLAIQPSPKDPIVIIKPAEPSEKPAAKAPVGEQPAEVGHFSEDGNPFHAESDEIFEIDAKDKARMKNYKAEMAAANTARERNEATMRHIEASPFSHTQENYYNFLKAHPDFDYATAAPELKQKCRDALNADTAKIRAEADQLKKINAKYEQDRKPVDMRPSLVGPKGTVYFDEGGNQ